MRNTILPRPPLKPFHARAARLLVGALLIFFSGVTTLKAASWKAGFARAKITPAEPIMLGGYAARSEPFHRVDQDILVKAFALKDNAGNRAILLTCDVVGFRAALANPIIERVVAATGVSRECIILNSSHNHTGPSASASAGANLNQIQSAKLAKYQEWLQETIVSTAVSALQNLSPAEMSYGSGLALFVVNRREPTPAGIKLGVNPRGPSDRTVPVLRITGPDGRLRGVVFGAACHATTLPARENAVSGDYPGFAQAFLEEKHAGIQAMFMQGFGGDQGPYPTGKADFALQNGRALGAEVARVLAEGKLAPVCGPFNAGQVRVRLPLDPPKTMAEIEELTQSPQLWQKLAASRMLVRWYEGVRPLTEYEAPFTVWQFGSDLTLAALPGEVVVDYATRLAEALGPLRLWLASYCNDVFGYLPSARVLREGGYETRGVYTGEKFAPEVEELVVTVMRDLARQEGRKLPLHQ